METGLIIVLFLSNAFALDCLYNHRIKTTGALIILNLCLTVALAYQFQQMQKIFYVLLSCAGIVALFFGVKLYLRKKHDTLIIENKNKIIEEKEEIEWKQ